MNQQKPRSLGQRGSQIEGPYGGINPNGMYNQQPTPEPSPIGYDPNRRPSIGMPAPYGQMQGRVQQWTNPNQLANLAALLSSGRFA